MSKSFYALIQGNFSGNGRKLYALTGHDTIPFLTLQSQKIKCIKLCIMNIFTPFFRKSKRIFKFGSRTPAAAEITLFVKVNSWKHIKCSDSNDYPYHQHLLVLQLFTSALAAVIHFQASKFRIIFSFPRITFRLRGLFVSFIWRHNSY